MTVFIITFRFWEANQGIVSWCMFSDLSFFLVWHWPTIFGTWVYHHKTMCRVHSWSRLDVDLWPPGQFYRLLSCLHVQPVTSVSFDIGIPYLAHGSITKRGCVKYIHDPDMTLTFDLKVKFIGFMTWLCLGLTFFVLWHSHTLLCMWVYHHGTMCHIQSWTLYDLDLWPQYQNYIFTMNLNLARCLCSLT